MIFQQILLPNQPLTRYTKLVSSISQSNHSSGFYKSLFDDNNIILLKYDGLYVSSTYWPPPYLSIWQAGRFNYNSSRIALMDSLGKFISFDNYIFSTYDYGMVMQRRLIMDSDVIFVFTVEKTCPKINHYTIFLEHKIILDKHDNILLLRYTLKNQRTMLSKVPSIDVIHASTYRV